MTHALILHPTMSTPVPVTHCPPAGKKMRKPRTRKAGAPLSNDDLRALLKAKGLKFTSKHTKAELMAILASGQTFVSAAQVRENAARKAKRAAEKLAQG